MKSMPDLEKDPITVAKSLRLGLHKANNWLRERNKENILTILTDLMIPTLKEDYITMTHILGTTISRMLIDIFAPNYSQVTYEAGEKFLSQQKYEKEQILNTSVRILDHLDHPKRLLFLRDAMMKSVAEANEKWNRLIPTKITLNAYPLDDDTEQQDF